MNSTQDDFVKIVVDIPEGDLGIFGEGLWTKSLGEDLYEIQNSPWHSREINYLDIVKAVAPSEDKNPQFVEVVKRGGHRTIHVLFSEDSFSSKAEILSKLNTLGATYEGANEILYALDFAPAIDWGPARRYLQSLEDQKLLEWRWSAY